MDLTMIFHPSPQQKLICLADTFGPAAYISLYGYDCVHETQRK